MNGRVDERGIVYDGTETKLVDGLELCDPGPRDVIVDIAAAGLCHSDLSYMSGIYPYRVLASAGMRVPASSPRLVRPSPT